MDEDPLCPMRRFRHQECEINKMSAIVKIERQGAGAVLRAKVASNHAAVERRGSFGRLIALAKSPVNLGDDLNTVL